MDFLLKCRDISNLGVQMYLEPYSRYPFLVTLALSLVRPPSEDDPSADATNQDDFHPEFTYPVFGEQEMIFGYKGLDIKV